MKKLLSTKEAADHIGISKSQLEKLRVSGGGPRYIKLRWQVRYDPDDLDRWFEDNKRASTADTPAARVAR